MSYKLIIPEVFYIGVRKDELEHKREHLNIIIELNRQKLLMWASCDPKSIEFDKEEHDNLIEYINTHVLILIDELEEYSRELQLCELAISKIDEVTECK